jgi:hypothetical protein
MTSKKNENGRKPKKINKRNGSIFPPLFSGNI